MNKFKVVVYAIAKNEENFAEKWAKNMSEADEIVVMLDPTSTDNTKKILEENGVKVYEKQIKPWRFDVARNESLKFVPKDADICVCTDLDELFTPNWRQELENKWTKDTNQAVYKYYHNAYDSQSAPNIFDYSKIHDRNSFKWIWAVHEYIVTKKKGMKVNQIVLENIMLKHYPDLTKPRSSYKSLLELGIKEDKNSTRYLGLLIEEYFNCKDYNKANELLERFLKIKNLHIQDVCTIYKYKIKIASELKDYDNVKKYCYEALSKCDYCKIFYAELGKYYVLQEQNYELGIALLKKSLTIKHDVIIAREAEWNDIALINNLISIGYYYMQDYKNAIQYVDIAIKTKPNEKCYKDNKELYKNQMKNAKNASV